MKKVKTFKKTRTQRRSIQVFRDVIEPDAVAVQPKAAAPKVKSVDVNVKRQRDVSSGGSRGGSRVLVNVLKKPALESILGHSSSDELISYGGGGRSGIPTSGSGIPTRTTSSSSDDIC
jgi:hypothetical protein